MSTQFRVQAGASLPRRVIDDGRDDIRWLDEVPGDPLPPGRRFLYLDRISTRVTTVDYDGDYLTISVYTSASFEDCELARDILRRAATLQSSPVETERGSLSVPELDASYGEPWVRQELQTAAGIFVKFSRERGPIEVPGPTRSVWIGPRSAAELERGEPADAHARLLTLMRRVLWTDPRYETRATMRATAQDGSSYTVAMLLPGRACVLPKTDRIAVADPREVFQIDRAALAHLPIETAWLDDGNQLAEAVSLAEWPDFCRRAHAYALDP